MIHIVSGIGSIVGLAETCIQHLECNTLKQPSSSSLYWWHFESHVTHRKVDWTRRFKVTQGTQVNKSRFGTSHFFLSWFRWCTARFFPTELEIWKASAVNLPLLPSRWWDHHFRQLFQKMSGKPPKMGKFHRPPGPPPQFPSTSNIPQPCFSWATAPDAPNGQSRPQCHGVAGKQLIRHLPGQLLKGVFVSF